MFRKIVLFFHKMFLLNDTFLYIFLKYISMNKIAKTCFGECGNCSHECKIELKLKFVRI